MNHRTRVTDIIADVIGAPAELIEDDTELVADLGFDSIDMVATVMALEEEFEIEIEDSDADGWGVVSDILKTIVEQWGPLVKNGAHK